MNWGRTTDTKLSSFFMNGFGRRANANIYYSPGVDRLFAVDNYDPYTAMEIAQILSSKMPAIAVLILYKDELKEVNNGNCINYTIKNKNPIPGQAALLFSRQMPVVKKLLSPQLVLVEDFPADFNYNENLNTFVLFSEYAKFVIRVWHTAKICDMTHNVLPMGAYNSFLADVKPEGWTTPPDNVNGDSNIGITTEIKRILYFSDNIEEALERIADMWRANNTPLSIHWRKQFYALIEEEQEPVDLQQSKLNMDNYSGYLL